MFYFCHSLALLKAKGCQNFPTLSMCSWLQIRPSAEKAFIERLSSSYPGRLGCQNHSTSRELKQEQWATAVPWASQWGRPAGSARPWRESYLHATWLHPPLCLSPCVTGSRFRALGGSLWLSNPWWHVHTLGASAGGTVAFLRSISDGVGSRLTSTQPPRSIPLSRRRRCWPPLRAAFFFFKLIFILFFIDF